MPTKEDMRAWLRKKKHFAVNAENRQEVDMCDSILAALSGPGEEERERLWRFVKPGLCGPLSMDDVINQRKLTQADIGKIRAVILGHAGEGGKDLCRHCGKAYEDSKHIKYGNDYDAQNKHGFEPTSAGGERET